MLDSLESLRALVGGSRDGALLRYALGNALLERGELLAAADELRHALQFDPDYSAAWKLLGRALVEAKRPVEALAAWRSGIEVAQRCGDTQAEKEMRVFLRRLESQKS